MFDILLNVENLTAHKGSLLSTKEASKATVTTSFKDILILALRIRREEP